MRHPGIALAAALAIVVTGNAATAASLPSGTISCMVFGDLTEPNGQHRLKFLPPISSTPTPGRIRVFTYMQGTCDNSGVSGGKAPITNVHAHLVGSLAAPHTNCDAFTSAPVFDRLKLKIKWQAADVNGRLRTVAVSSVRFVDANWDDDAGALVLTSTPLKGAFAGSLSTVTLAFDFPELFGPICDNGAHLDGVDYGGAGTSSLTIQ